eukprot:GCRY01001635.1.p2 GENE.GCRY01001635.1~~GCRY01001635.1.p2  ORF type:complete len:116 (+),score=23.75 GCRY01001635.1:343-690(+)
MYEEYQPQGFEILAFPCNQFGKQEPGTHEEIRAFVDNFGVKFQMTTKIDVNGKNEDPLWTFLKKHKKPSILGKNVKWNFTKFLINRKGEICHRFGPLDNPKGFESKIVGLLKETE